MPEPSTADHTQSPPQLDIARDYNAAWDLLQRNLLAGRGDKLAFIDDRGSYTYAQVDSLSSAFANGLRDSGLQMEQRILLCLHDGIDFPVAFLGAIKAGVVPIAVNTLLTADDYKYMLDDSRARLALVSAPLRDMFEELVCGSPHCRGLLVSGADDNDPASMSALLAAASPECEIAPTTADDMCFWLYSSGSTGVPKGTVHKHSSLIQTAELYARPTLRIDENDVVFSAAKLFFAYGLGNGLSFPMSVGATAVLMAERPSPEAVFARLRQYQPTIFCGVPTLYASLLASPALPQKHEMALRICTSAGEPLPEQLARQWSDHVGVEVLDGIGSTEMLHIFLSNRPGRLRYGTTGVAVPGYELRIVDEAGKTIEGVDEVGELQVAGPSSALFYWNNREKSQDTFQGRWVRSGDKYSRDADGFYIYAGRSDDMLKVGGIYVSPIEIEAVLIEHPAVLEVAVVGHKRDDELVKPAAYVVLKDGEAETDGLAEDLKQHVKNRLAPYKYPRWVVFVDALPKTATGKIQRFKLRGMQHP